MTFGIPFTPEDEHWFREGTHSLLYRRFGAHSHEVDGVSGIRFAVWAPRAVKVHLIGDMNQWQPNIHPLHREGDVWSAWIPDAKRGHRYKYRVYFRDGGWADKADPYGVWMEHPPETASVVWDLEHAWNDARWMSERSHRQHRAAPISIYEVHLGSWRRKADDRVYGYRELVGPLIAHVQRLGFTHVEFLPVMEHPFYGSWGYQVTGYFSATRRYGTPQDLMALIDELHQAGIGVILDWVPGHFPSDAHGLAWFDGGALYEHGDRRLGFHPEWNSQIFDFSRAEVRSFLISSARFWLETYHADGLRIDGVASILYRDYARGEGEWLPNQEGGREYWEAAQFLTDLNRMIRREFPDTLSFAEDSTTWPGMTKPTEQGGIGFDFKWDMGWMHDSLKYLALDPIHRRFHHSSMTFRSLYSFQENYLLPLSHDEVVHGKRALLDKMWGDEWQKRSGWRLMLGWMFAQPGKKLLFMGAEFGQWREWNHDRELDWGCLQAPEHQKLQEWLCTLARYYRDTEAMHQGDCAVEGFSWVNGADADRSVLTFLRTAKNGAQRIFVFNFTPVPRQDYWIGAPEPGRYVEDLNSDAVEYGGSGVGNPDGIETEAISWDALPSRLRVTLPPLGMLVLRRLPGKKAKRKIVK